MDGYAYPAQVLDTLNPHQHVCFDNFMTEEIKMDEQRIKEAAYELWEKAGKPDGQDLEHWFAACEVNTNTGQPTEANAEPGSAAETKAQAQQPMPGRGQPARKK
jgi:hypothetical protein